MHETLNIFKYIPVVVLLHFLVPFYKANVSHILQNVIHLLLLFYIYVKNSSIFHDESIDFE